MPNFYFTPASVGYLNQFLLSLLITIYLGMRHSLRKRDPSQRQDQLLLAFFFWVTVFSLLLFLEASFLPAERFIIICLQNTVLGFVLVALSQFVYHFPTVVEKQRLERQIVFWVTILYALTEAGVAIWRLNLLRDGRVIFRDPLLDFPIALEFLWVIFVFIRSSIRNWNRPVIRQFAWIFLIPLWLAFLNILRSYYAISTPFYHINMSVGILFTIFLSALAYLAAQPEKTSFITKLSGTVLTSVLVVFGTIAWLVAPAYARQYIPSIPDHRTIRFTPNEIGGYDVQEIPFQFEEQVGENLQLFDEIEGADRSIHETNFDFPFLGKNYARVFISNDGMLSMGSRAVWRDYQYHFTNIPMILPLLVDLAPKTESNNGVFLRRETDRLIVTYLEVPAYNRPEERYTFQVILFSDGSFDFTYNGLPDFSYHVDDRPEATAWAIGYKPAHAPQANANFTNLPQQGGSEGLLQDEHRAFRNYLHNFMLPVVIAVLISSLLFLIGLPLLLNVNFAQPLNNLIKGVQDLNRDRRDIHIPIQFNDEIGFLAAAFNTMTAELASLISNLEERVEQRTTELIEANRAIQNSQRFFEGLFEVSPDAILTVNEKGLISRVNARAEDMFGYPRAELFGKPIETLVAGDFTADHARQRQKYQEQPHARTVGAGRVIYGRRKNGREFPVDILLRPFDSKEGQLILAVIRDVSDRLEMENALHRRNETLSALDQIMLDLINRHDADDIVRTFLEKAGPLLDTPEVSIDLLQDENTLINYAPMKNLPIKEGATVKRSEGAVLSWQAVDTRQPVTVADYSAWAKRRPLFEGYPIHAVLIVPILQGDRVLGTINFTRIQPNHPFGETDIYVATQLAQMVALTLNNAQLYVQLRSELSDRRQIEDVLRISQQNFMSYFNMGSVGMCVITPEKDWVEVNDRLCKMLGYTSDELKQFHWVNLTHPDDLAAETDLFEQTLRDEYESRHMNKRFLRKDGSVTYASMYVSCQRHTDQSALYFLVSLVDITERILQEQALQQTQAELMEQKLTSATLEERQRLARNLHDSLSQSVHSLVLFSQTLQSSLDKNNIERAKRIVEQVQESARQSHKETRLLLYELQAPGKGRSVDLIHELESRLAKVENHAGIGSEIIVKGSVKDIPSAWTEDLYWMTIEALNNALKHAQARKMKIIINIANQELELEVVDDGRGFSLEKVGAGGMGLANLRERASLLGGELTIESELTKGTRVRFHVKIKEQHG